MYAWWTLSCLVSNVYCSCILQNSLYHNVDTGTMWHFALVSCTPSQSIGLFCFFVFFWFFLFWCSGSLCIPFTNSSIGLYFIMRVVTIIRIFMAIIIILFWTTCLGCLKQSSSGSTNAYLPGSFHPWILPLNIGLNMLPSDSFMPC